jgi:hypothetical protein
LRSYLGWQGAGGGSFLLQCTDPVTVSTVPRAAVYALTYVNTSPSDPAPPLTVSSSLMLNSRISLVMSFPCFKGGIIPSCTSGTQQHGKSFSAVYWLCDTHHHFKIGYCDFQIRPLRVELGQYRNSPVFGETKQRRCWVSGPSFSEGFRNTSHRTAEPTAAQS